MYICVSISIILAYCLIPDQAQGRCGRRGQDSLAGHRWAQLWLICDSPRITFSSFFYLQATLHTLQIWVANNSIYYL